MICVCVNSVSVYPGCVALKTGEWYYDVYAVACPADADCRDVRWYSSNTSVATVNATTGFIYARSAGTTRIYAEATDGSGCKDYITVTVTSGTIKVSSVGLNRSYVSIEEGESVALHATVCPVNASNKTLCWSSSNTNVAVVDSSGTVTAKSRGRATITATARDGSGVHDCCDINVTGDILVSSVSVSPSCKKVTIGSSFYLHETVCPTNATNKCVTWSSSNTSVATVNPCSGMVMAHKEGTATIYATATDGSGKRGGCTVTVNAPVSVTGVTICPTSITMNVAEIFTLSAGVCPVNATNKSVIWCSSDESVAEVDMRTGRVTAKKAGNVTITVTTVDGGYQDSMELKVVICTVTIKDDGNYSKIIFNDGKIWKCNGFYYDTSLESNLPIDYERSNHNASIDFTEKQLGFLFRIDPNGVIYYVKNKNLGKNMSPTDYLIYRDNIFKEIYGRLPNYFTYENSQLYYYTGINYNNRYSVYSEAELIFGILPRWTWQDVVKTLFSAVLSIISIYVPAIGSVLLTYDIVTAFFFTGAIEGAINSAANEFINEVIDSNYGNKLAKRFGWASTVVNLIPSLLETALPPDIDEEQISIYENAYQNDSYVIKISDSNQTVDLNEFIEHYKSLLP